MRQRQQTNVQAVTNVVAEMWREMVKLRINKLINGELKSWHIQS